MRIKCLMKITGMFHMWLKNVVMKMRDILASVLKNTTVFRQENIYRKYSAILGNINYKLTKKMLDKQKTLQSEERMKA